MKKVVEGVKDDKGAFIPRPKPIPEPDASLDDISKRILGALGLASKQLLINIAGGDVSRETIGALKDAHSIYKELRKDEKEFVESLSDEELENLSKK